MKLEHAMAASRVALGAALIGSPLILRGRRSMKDQFMTFDNIIQMPDARGNQLGKKLDFSAQFLTADGAYRTYDSTGAFLIGELERLDLTLNEPLADVQWSRDIDLREDVTIADEVSSFTISAYASAGQLGSNSFTGGKAWIGKATDQIGGVDVDIGKTTNPLRLWGIELKYTVPELESSAKMGRSVDVQKYDAMNLKWQMDTDAQVYIGDTDTGDAGLVNSALVAATSVPNDGTGSGTQWTTKTPAQILRDINTAITTTWTNSAYAVLPNRILVPPSQYGYIATTNVSSAGNLSILDYVLENNVAKKQGQRIDILPSKWLYGAGSGGTIGTPGTHDRMVVYSKDKKRVRFPRTAMQRTPLQFESIYQKTTYFCRLGRVEFVYPETLTYWDGI